MAELRIHIIALQDVGYIFKSLEGKQIYGNYQIHYFKFGDNKSDTLAFIIDEGVFFHYMKVKETINNQKARSSVLILRSIINNTQFYLLNPAKQQDKQAYIH